MIVAGNMLQPEGARADARALRLQHVVGDDDRTLRQLRMQQLEHRHVQILPQVDQHEIEWSRELPERCERIADAKLDVFREPGARSEERRVGKECRSRWSAAE